MKYIMLVYLNALNDIQTQSLKHKQSTAMILESQITFLTSNFATQLSLLSHT